jgi:hypothetical protein
MVWLKLKKNQTQKLAMLFHLWYAPASFKNLSKHAIQTEELE